MTPADRTEGPAGYVRLWRRILENPVWTQLSPAVLKVMIGFLLKANWKPATWYDGSAEIEIPRGSFVTSYPKMAQFCNLTLKQTRLAFDHLQRLHFAAYQRAPKWTLVTVLNYSTYQDSAGDEGRIEGGLRARSGHDEGTMRAPIEEGNKGTNTSAPLDAGVRGFRSICDRTFDATGTPALFPIESPKKERRTHDLAPEQERWFTAWWAEYWRRVSKKDAREAFRKQVQTEARFQQMMAATRAQRSAMLARPEDKRPYPATWLNGERWEDETSSVQPAQAAGSVYRKLEIPA